jgi:hypothetical protein
MHSQEKYYLASIHLIRISGTDIKSLLAGAGGGISYLALEQCTGEHFGSEI